MTSLQKGCREAIDKTMDEKIKEGRDKIEVQLAIERKKYEHELHLKGTPPTPRLFASMVMFYINLIACASAFKRLQENSRDNGDVPKLIL